MKDIIHFCQLTRMTNVAFIGLYQVMLRYCVVLPTLALWGIEPAMTTVEFTLLVAATMALTASGNVINDYFDVRCDLINRPERQIVDKHISRKATILIHVILTLIGVFLGLLLSFLFRREAYAMFFVCIPVILWFYSTHFKKQMLIGNMVVALMMAAVGLLAVSVEISAIVASRGGDILGSPACDYAWKFTAAFAFFSFICNLSREIIKDMEDVEGDMACECHTLPVEMGIPNSKIVVILLEIAKICVLWSAYAVSDMMSSKAYMFEYVLIGLTIPTLVLCFMLMRAHDQKDYHTLSNMSKAIMAIGVLSMAYAHFLA